MIGWILERLAQNPEAVFWRTELEGRFPDAFSAGVADHLLRPVPADLWGTFTDTRNGHTYALVEHEGEVEGWDEDDPDAPPIHLTARQLGRFRVDFSVLAERFRVAHGLAGPTEVLHARLHLVGTGELSALGTLAIVLGFFPSAASALPHLRTLRQDLTVPCTQIAVLLPAGHVTGADKSLLRRDSIVVVDLAQRDPLTFDLRGTLLSESSAHDAAEQQSSSSGGIALGTLSLQDLRTKYAGLSTAGHRATRLELAAALNVNDSTLSRRLKRLGVRWSAVIAPM